MTNVIQFPTRPPARLHVKPQLGDEFEIRKQSIAELFTAGTLPQRGDHVFHVAGGGGGVSTPGDGMLTKAHVEQDRRRITFHFSDGTTITAPHNWVVKWYPRAGA